MTAADEFTRASPTYIQAQRHAARSGDPLEVPGRAHPERSSWWLVLIGLALVSFAIGFLGL